jgi:hypothetical protein
VAAMVFAENAFFCPSTIITSPPRGVMLETKTLFLIPVTGVEGVLVLELEPHPASRTATIPTKIPETYFSECIPRFDPAFCAENADYNRAGSPGCSAAHQSGRRLILLTRDGERRRN